MTIFGLPNEILQDIFSRLSVRDTWIDVDKTEWNFSEISNEDIKNVRLACKHFRDNATHLVDQIRVDLSVNSALRFETMCGHSKFQRGVQAVEICLAQYDSRLATNFQDFTKYHIRQLERYRPESTEMMIKVDQILTAWRKLSAGFLDGAQEFENPSSNSKKELDFMNTLMDGYKQYGRNHREQQALIHRGVFAPRVAAALAELKHATHLELTDWETIRWGDRFSNRLRHLNITTNTTLLHSLSQWRMPFDEVEGLDVMHVIPDLLSELHSAGKLITSLNIQLSPAFRTSYLHLSVPRPRELRRGLSNLRSLRFEIHPASPGNRAPMLTIPGFRALANFFDQILDSPTLEAVIIDAGHNTDWTTSLINAHEWPVLKYVELKNVATTEADLDTLTALFPPFSRNGFPILVLHCVYLVSGTWDGVFNTFTARDIMVSQGTPRGRRGARHARLRLGERQVDQEQWRIA